MDYECTGVLRLKDIEDKIKREILDIRNRIDLVKLIKAIVYLKEKLKKHTRKKRKRKMPDRNIISNRSIFEEIRRDIWVEGNMLSYVFLHWGKGVWVATMTLSCVFFIAT